LKEGKAADLVVLDKDPLQTAAEAIPEIKVKMTVAGGRIVYHGRS
jgi:predicted amidohydrolase YtcJ